MSTDLQPEKPDAEKALLRGLKTFTFYVENGATKEIGTFAGQGPTMADAWKEGYGNLTTAWRPNSSGVANEHNAVMPSLTVILPSGAAVNRKREEFEGSTPFPGPLPPKNPEPKTSDQIALPIGFRRRRGEA